MGRGQALPGSSRNCPIGELVHELGLSQYQISSEDFEYLRVIGELIGAAVGKAELSEQLNFYKIKRQDQFNATFLFKVT